MTHSFHEIPPLIVINEMNKREDRINSLHALNNQTDYDVIILISMHLVCKVEESPKIPFSSLMSYTIKLYS